MLDFAGILKSITYAGEKFSGYNKPKRTPKHKTKSHAVAKERLLNQTVKQIRLDVSLSKLDMQKISNGEKCLLHIGRTK